MEIQEYKNIFENESSHIFYVGTHQIILSLVKKYIKRRGLEILDAGCGTGLLAKKMQEFGQVWGIDIHPEAIKYAKKRGIKVKKASVTNIPFKDNFFDLVVSIDVIYHQQVEDDQKTLREFFRVLKPEGILIIRVPANKWIKTRHDQYVHTRERYSREELKMKLMKAGFLIKKLTFINATAFPLSIFQHLINKIPSHQPSSIITPLPNYLNLSLLPLLWLENFIMERIGLPFGVGLIAVCKKPTSI